MPRNEFDKIFDCFACDFKIAINEKNNGITQKFRMIGSKEATFRKFYRDFDDSNTNYEHYHNYFKCDQKKYLLNPNESIKLEFKFDPKEIGQFHIDVPIKCYQSFDKYSIKLNAICDIPRICLQLESNSDSKK